MIEAANTEETILTVTARHLQPGDHTMGMVVSSLSNYPDGSKEFKLVVPFTVHTMLVSVKEKDLDAVKFDLTKRGDTHNTAPRNKALGLPLELHQTVYKQTHVEPVATYPVGTKVQDIKHFDRSMKVAFACPAHPKSAWVSKDPYSSSHFPQSDETVDCTGHRQCKIPVGDYVVTHEYKPTRNG